MKQFIHYLTFCAFLLALTPLNAQRVTFSPEKPIPGEKITVTFNPEGSPLASLSSFETTAFLFEDDMPTAVEVEMKAEGGLYTGFVKTGEKTKAVMLSLKNAEEEKKDNNDDTGYKVLCYNQDRTMPVQGAYAAKAGMYSSYGFPGDIKRDFPKAFNLIKREFSEYPESKKNKDYFATYAMLAQREKDEAALAEVKGAILTLSNAKKATEDDLAQAQTLCNRIDNKDLAAEIEQKMKQKYPNGKVAKNEMIKSFNDVKDVAGKIAIYEKVKKKYGKDEGIDGVLNNFTRTIASTYSKDKDWTNFRKYVAMMTNKANRANSLNSAAWVMSGESIEGEGNEMALGKEFSNESLMLLREEMDNPSGKPAYMTNRQWKKNMESSYAMYADTYALLAFKTGNPAEALQYQQISCEKNRFKDGEMNERYCIYFEKVKGGKEAEKVLARFISEGNANSKMKAQHKELFLANNNLESAYEKYIVSLEAKAMMTKKAELKDKMLNIAAPGFRLVNLKGEEVSLEGLKGKVVVLDFWATWCGPCIASFPGMQKAVNNYSDNKDVVFLFIDTWERSDNKAKLAGDFIESKQYTFNVLMDDKDEVVAKFGVEGIPTKFVVDKNGMIRFKSVGFGGNDEELVQELTLMIEMAGGSSPVKLTGAP